jgi:hypothetical protein
MFVPSKGATFLFRVADGDFHLHICLTDPFDMPTEIPEQTLVVSATTLRGFRGEDLTCQLHPGDHDFIINESIIAYSKWLYVTPGGLQKSEKAGLIKERAPVTEAIFQRIREGLFKSPRVPKCARNFLFAYEQATKNAKK